MKDLPAGHVIRPDDIRRIRPGMGLAPKYVMDVIGASININVVSGMPVSWDVLD